MKIQEAIENLRHLISGDCTDNQMDFVEEIEMAINVLEKQIPQKPIEDGYYEEPAVCPNCGESIIKLLDENYSIQYCLCCGQALDFTKRPTEKGGEKE